MVAIMDKLTCIWSVTVAVLDSHAGAITTVATVVIAAFTIALAISTKRLWKEARDAGATATIAANAARDSADAYIAGLMPVLSPLVIGGNLHPFGKVSTPITFNALVHFVFENYGKIPATIREVSADLILNQRDELPEVDFEKLPTLNYAPIIPGESRGENAHMGAAEFTKKITLDANTFNELLAEANNDTYRRFALVGRVIYDDLLGYRHTRIFCVKLRRMGGDSLFQLIWGGVSYNSISRKKIPDNDSL
jgi:hypothetical protein